MIPLKPTLYPNLRLLSFTPDASLKMRAVYFLPAAEGWAGNTTLVPVIGWAVIEFDSPTRGQQRETAVVAYVVSRNSAELEPANGSDSFPGIVGADADAEMVEVLFAVELERRLARESTSTQRARLAVGTN